MPVSEALCDQPGRLPGPRDPVGHDPAALARTHGKAGVAQQRLAGAACPAALTFGAGVDSDAGCPPKQFPRAFEHFRLRAFGIAFEEGQRVDPVIFGEPIQSDGPTADNACLAFGVGRVENRTVGRGGGKAEGQLFLGIPDQRVDYV